MFYSDEYLKPNKDEKELSRVVSFLDELRGIPWEKHWLEGYHPDVYNKYPRGINLVPKTQALVQEIAKVNINDFSLEMQIWWRDYWTR